MSRTVYVVTTAPTSREQRARHFVLLVLARLFIFMALVGHFLLLVLGALDALVAAALGTRRVSVVSRQLADVTLDSWKESNER